MISKGLKKLIALAKSRKASDVHICAGAPILFRIGRDLVPAMRGNLSPQVSERMTMDLLSEVQQEQFRQRLDYDLMIADEGGRYRVNISYNDGAIGAVIRILPDHPRSLEELGLPPVVQKMTQLTKGLILITGSTSTGKSTTM